MCYPRSKSVTAESYNLWWDRLKTCPIVYEGFGVGKVATLTTVCDKVKGVTRICEGNVFRGYSSIFQSPYLTLLAIVLPWLKFVSRCRVLRQDQGLCKNQVHDPPALSNYCYWNIIISSINLYGYPEETCTFQCDFETLDNGKISLVGVKRIFEFRVVQNSWMNVIPLPSVTFNCQSKAFGMKDWGIDGQWNV